LDLQHFLPLKQLGPIWVLISSWSNNWNKKYNGLKKLENIKIILTSYTEITVQKSTYLRTELKADVVILMSHIGKIF
jgi:hypothetical protein